MSIVQPKNRCRNAIIQSERMDLKPMLVQVALFSKGGSMNGLRHQFVQLQFFSQIHYQVSTSWTITLGQIVIYAASLPCFAFNAIHRWTPTPRCGNS